MRDIYIRPEEAMDMSAKIRSMSGKTGSISRSLKSIMSSLDWEVSAKGSIGNMAAHISSRLDRLAERAEALGNGSNRAALEFRNADTYMARNMEGLLKDMRRVSTTVAVLTLKSNVNMGAGGNSTKDFFQKASEWFKDAGEALKKFGEIVADGISGLLDRIKDFFKKDKVPAGNKTAAEGMDNNPFNMDIEGIRASNPTMSEILTANPNLNKDNWYEEQKYYCAWLYGTHSVEQIAGLKNASYVLAYIKLKGIDASPLTVTDMDDIYNKVNSLAYKFESTVMLGTMAYGLYKSGSVKGMVKTIDDILPSGITREGLTNVAGTPGKGGVTPIGRAFQKHAGNAQRAGTFTGEVTGNVAKNTEQGINYLNQVLDNPNSTAAVRNTKAYGDVLDVRMPDGTGVRYSADGKTFIGFLEKYTPTK